MVNLSAAAPQTIMTKWILVLLTVLSNNQWFYFHVVVR